MAKGRRSVKKEKKNLKILIIVVAIVIIVAVLGFFLYKIIESKSDKLLTGYSLYKTTNYTIQYESDWASSVSDTNPNMTVFLSQDISNSNLNNTTNNSVQNDLNNVQTGANTVQDNSITTPAELGIINVITENLTTPYTLDQYVDESINNLKSTFNLEDSNIGKEKVSINGKDAYRISYSASAVTRITQTIFLSGSTAYIISYNSADNFFDVYHNMENTLVMK
ncbi:MAG: hypothetical protein FWF46_05130 [Oscillospiraceae bacterium]|nr:hypothetical protein [Oscillospiraceae bacterium]